MDLCGTCTRDPVLRWMQKVSFAGSAGRSLGRSWLRCTGSLDHGVCAFTRYCSQVTYVNGLARFTGEHEITYEKRGKESVVTAAK